MIRRPPRSTRTYTLCPYTTLFRSHEGAEPLETGGGLLHALPLLGDAPFLVVNGDVYCDVDFATLPRAPQTLAHLLMVEPPAHSAHGDFALGADGSLHTGSDGPGGLLKPSRAARVQGARSAGTAVYVPVHEDSEQIGRA